MINRLYFHILVLVFLSNLFATTTLCKINEEKKKNAIIVSTAIINEKLTLEWKDALITRMSKERIDSFGNLQRPLSPDELAWKKMIESKATVWNGYRDSLALPFKNIVLADTITVLLGYLGDDDAFTYRSQSVCLDLTALYRAYGKADLLENSNRIDRIFAHEYTHLLHKAWMTKKGYIPVSFKDSILWECWYEGIGMYRSLSDKWLLANDSLPAITRTALAELYPVFTDRMIAVNKRTHLSTAEKQALNARLSRGPVDKKWGAFTVAAWLMLEAKGDDENLIKWINKGPTAVIQLAQKYLPEKLNLLFSAAFEE